MSNMKVENWNGHNIRFVEVETGEWWAVLKDVCDALEIEHVATVRKRLSDDVASNHPITDALGRLQDTTIVNEDGIYDTIFDSRKTESKAFRKWVFSIIKQLREASGLAQYETFKLMEKEWQKIATSKLKEGLKGQAEPKHYMKANTIANKAVSTLYGFNKSIKKDEMSSDMIVKRLEILDDC